MLSYKVVASFETDDVYYGSDLIETIGIFATLEEAQEVLKRWENHLNAFKDLTHENIALSIIEIPLFTERSLPLTATVGGKLELYDDEGVLIEDDNIRETLKEQYKIFLMDHVDFHDDYFTLTVFFDPFDGRIITGCSSYRIESLFTDEDRQNMIVKLMEDAEADRVITFNKKDGVTYFNEDEGKYSSVNIEGNVHLHVSLNQKKIVEILQEKS